MRNPVRNVVFITVVLVFGAVGLLTAQGAVEYMESAQQVEVHQTMMHTVDEGLLHMREEEKLARDVYLTLYDQWGFRVFAQIARSEQRHMESIAALLAYRNLDDPAAEAQIGQFTNVSLQQLYDDLIAQGSQGPIDALTVGAIVEDLDIYDLEMLLAQTDDPVITRVYTSLLRASEQHIRSFVRQLERLGASYEPRYISAEKFDAIMSR